MKMSAFFTTLLLFSGTSMAAQSPVGTWIRVSSIIEDTSGTKTDLQESLAMAMPCIASMTYSFLPDGKVNTTTDACPEAMKKASQAADAVSRWKASGNKIVVTTSNGSLPPATYVVTYQANTMTWAFSFADNPKTPNPMNAKATIIVFQRLN
ncbi:MAG: lipocalin family protein [Methylococcales bacterium]